MDLMCRVTLWWEESRWWCAIRYPHSPSRNLVTSAPELGGATSLVLLTDWALSHVPRPLQAGAAVDVISPMGVPMTRDWIQPAMVRALRRSKQLTALRTPWPALKRRPRRPTAHDQGEASTLRPRLSMP